jgi:hypothetical protein
MLAYSLAVEAEPRRTPRARAREWASSISNAAGRAASSSSTPRSGRARRPESLSLRVARGGGLQRGEEVVVVARAVSITTTAPGTRALIVAAAAVPLAPIWMSSRHTSGCSRKDLRAAFRTPSTVAAARTKRGAGIATSMQTEPRHSYGVSHRNPAVARRGDRLEGVGRFGRNPSYDVPNNRPLAILRCVRCRLTRAGRPRRHYRLAPDCGRGWLRTHRACTSSGTGVRSESVEAPASQRSTGDLGGVASRPLFRFVRGSGDQPIEAGRAAAAFAAKQQPRVGLSLVV